MNLSRRGFLHTMLAAAVGTAATFDPLRKLWVPGAVAAAEAQLILPAGWTWDGPKIEKVADEILELNDLALRFAQQMAQRLERHSGRVLQEALYRDLGGDVFSAPRLAAAKVSLTDAIETPEWGVGQFVPAPYRIVKTLETTRPHMIQVAASSMRDEVDTRSWRRGFDMFAPVSGELRPGVGFNDTLVGMATDPDSGLSVRVLRYRNWDGIRLVPVTAFEMAVGTWRPEAEVKRTLTRDAFDAAWHAAGGDDQFTWADAEGNVHTSKKDMDDDEPPELPREIVGVAEEDT